jgi:hypothetical protein
MLKCRSLYNISEDTVTSVVSETERDLADDETHKEETAGVSVIDDDESSSSSLSSSPEGANIGRSLLDEVMSVGVLFCVADDAKFEVCSMWLARPLSPRKEKLKAGEDASAAAVDVVADDAAPVAEVVAEATVSEYVGSWSEKLFCW